MSEDTPLAPSRARSTMSDGEWHRMHPLTPLFRGGLALIIVIGFVVTNLRDRLVEAFLPSFSDEYDYSDMPGDPIDFVLANNLVLWVLLSVLGVVVLLIAIFWTAWRFHTFRITGDNVEVKSGVLFRTQRRAPLDRVQGVNLVRPLVARLFGLAKLEVVGAGLDANVRLEYLSTANAEAVRHDILLLASGQKIGQVDAPQAPGTWRVGAADAFSSGVTGIVDGAEAPVEASSVVRIPVGRLIGSTLLSTSTIVQVLVIVGLVIAAINGSPWIMFALVPAFIGYGAYVIRRITRSLRYSIAPTEHGVRIVFGLFTTITEVLPPGRVHAIQVRQPLLWRPAGWWTISINRLSGTKAGQEAADAFTNVMPVGTRADVERVLELLMPWLDKTERALVFEHGLVAAPASDDPYTTTPRARRFIRPFSWRRNGFALSDAVLFLRRGRWQRSLALVPLERMQSIAVHQGPLARMLGLAEVRAHTIAGSVYTGVGEIAARDALYAFEESERRAIQRSATDRSHRWRAHTQEATDEP